MNTINPEVSVVLPTYNREATILKSIDSVLSQYYTDFELIVVDDGSTDRTEELIKKISDSRIRYIKLPVNQGVTFARNSGIMAARGNYIAFQDSDDEWRLDKLSIQMEVMKAMDSSFGLVYTSFYYELENGRLDWPPKDLPDQIKNGYIYPYLLEKNLVGGPTMLVPKECFQKVGLFNTEIRSMEDYELALRLAKYYNVVLINEPLVKAHQTPGSLSKDIMAHIQASCIILKLYKEDIIKYGLLEQKLMSFRTLGKKLLSDEQIEKMIELVLK